jgi:DnaJ family protein C protein 19
MDKNNSTNENNINKTNNKEEVKNNQIININEIKHPTLYKIIRKIPITIISSYIIIKCLSFLRRRNPQIFIIPRNIGGVLGRYYKGGFQNKMNLREACLILNVSDNKNIKKIRESYKKLMMLNHPDSGGSTYISSKINEAKDFLIKYRSGRKLL